MSNYLTRLYKLYNEVAGITITSGLNPMHFNSYRDAPFTHYFKDGNSLSPHLGISLWETVLFEKLCESLRPKGIFIIGNGLGWSALALSSINPDASVVAIDPDTGIELTNLLAFREGLRCIVVRAASPIDNRRVIEDYFDDRPDFVLIDAVHEAEAISRDFHSVYAICGPGTVYTFHDIFNFGLVGAFNELTRYVAIDNMCASILASSPSGIGIIYPNNAPSDFIDTVAVFSNNPLALQLVARISGATNYPGGQELVPGMRVE